MIYFIGKNWRGPVKIGFSTNPQKRLEQIQTGNPYKMRILYLAVGSFYMEKRLHKLFKKHRYQGEWFEGKVIKEFLDNIFEHQREAKTLFTSKDNFLGEIFSFRDNSDDLFQYVMGKKSSLKELPSIIEVELNL